MTNCVSLEIMTRTSIVEYFGDHTSYRCGYCKNNEGSYSHGEYLMFKKRFKVQGQHEYGAVIVK